MTKNGLRITDVILVKNRNSTNPIFYASIVINEAFVLKGFKVLRNNEDGTLFVSLPSQKDQKGRTDNEGRIIFYPTCYFLKESNNKMVLTENALEFKEHLNEELIKAANNYLNKEYQSKIRY